MTLGQKIIQKQPECAQDVNGQMMVLIQRRMPELVEKLKARISRSGATQAATRDATRK